MNGRSVRRVSLPLLAVLSFGGCVAEPEVVLAPRFVDLAGDPLPGLGTNESVELGSFFCHDQRRWGLSLDSGAEATFSLDVSEAPRLELEACLHRLPGTTIGPRRPMLEVTAEDETGVVFERSLPLKPGWQRASVELEGVAERDGLRLRIRAGIADGYRVSFKDLFVEHRTPTAAIPLDGQQVLLISLDTMRADAIGAFGGHYATPRLDALATRSQTFTPHYAAASWTKPSHASMLTGELPAVHGVKDFEARIAEGLPTIAERLAERGVTTGAMVFDCKILEPRFGFSRGFDRYEIRDWQASTASRWVYEWIAEHRDEPFFFFFHTFEPHSDLDQLSYEGPGAHRRLIERQFGVPGYGCSGWACGSNRLALIDKGEIEPLENEREILDFLYGKGVEETDRALGRLFDALESAGLLDRMTVIVTSDHGEEFFEHGSVLHGKNWEEILRVPLIVKWAQDRHAGERVDLATSSIDLAPTILDLYGVEAPDLPGQRLGGELEATAVFSGTYYAIVIQGPWKLARRGDTFSLFDLENDSLQRNDLSLERPQILSELKEVLLRRAQRDEERSRGLSRGDAELTPEEREQLEALGYLEAGEPGS